MNYKVAPTKVAWESKKALDAGYRIIVNQGGTRSGKTYSIIDVLIGVALTTKQSISITSLSFPHLRRGAMRDWKNLMEEKGSYSPKNHVKSDQKYQYPLGGYIEFFSLESGEKVRGPGRDILFINEANLIDSDTWQQLIFRTTKTIFIDYNPADEFHWIYDQVLPREDCYFIQSNYLDNPFLPKIQREEIERTRDLDQNNWRVFGLGERGSNEAAIYTSWKTYESISGGEITYGLDFGYNHPSALVKQTMKDKCRYWEQMVYESHLTNQQLIEKVKPIVGHSVIWCDYAEPARIEEFRRAGMNVKNADKNVKGGIDEVMSKPLFIQKHSADLIKEIKSYKWQQDKNGVIMKDAPVKINDDGLDAGRYAAAGSKTKPVIHTPTFHRKENDFAL